MSAPDEATVSRGEVEAVAEVIQKASLDRFASDYIAADGREWLAGFAARAVLTSEWLAQRDAAQRAEGVNEGIRLAAQLVRDHMLNDTGGRVADFLIFRANRVKPARIARTEPDHG